MNIDLLRARMSTEKISVLDISNALGMNQSTFYRKLHSNGDSFSVSHVRTIARVLHLTDDEANLIFFT